jgi:hypothetical protein
MSCKKAGISHCSSRLNQEARVALSNQQKQLFGKKVLAIATLTIMTVTSAWATDQGSISKLSIQKNQVIPITKPVNRVDTSNGSASPSAEKERLPVIVGAKVESSDTTPFDEAMVMAYNAKKKDAAADAHPKTGWTDFGKYINDKAVAADNKTGLVKVSFTVSGNGILSDFNVAQSLSTADDKAAIDLIKQGPNWIGNANGASKTVTVSISFHKA